MNLDSILSTLGEKQQAYFANQGMYWQGVVTHTSTPDTEALADNLMESPNGVYWFDWFPEFRTTPMPFSLQCDVYDGPNGAGYVVAVRQNGQVKRIVCGNDQSMAHDWQAE